MASLTPSSDISASQARLAGFERLALLAAETNGRLWLEGVDENIAGLTDADFLACHTVKDPSASAFSFCVNGFTFTAIENPEDGYRSSMGELIERPGNHCKNRFLAAPLSLRLDGSFPEGAERQALIDAGSAADLISLRYPGVDQEILSVGTEDCDNYYPSFASHFSPQAYTQALALFQAEQVELASQPGSDAHAPARAPRL